MHAVGGIADQHQPVACHLGGVEEAQRIAHTRGGKRKLSERERDEEIRKLEKQMQEASRMLEFEYAAILRDRIIELRKENTK